MLVHYKIKHPGCSKTVNTGLVLILLSLNITSCKKFVDVDPPLSTITSSVVYSSNTSAAAVMSGVYSNMIYTSALSSGNSGLSLLEGLAADELTDYFPLNPTYAQFYKNALASSTSGVSNKYFWQEIFQQIHIANALMEGLVNSAGVTPSMKQQLDGEAKFIRAFYYFYAVNLYGDVPLVTTTDYVTNNTIKKTPKSQVYQQIIKDLTDARAELSTSFVDASGFSTTERVRPNKGAAEALLARVYLYTGDWTDAEAEADSVINNTNYNLLTDLTQVFLMNSQEAIWQLAPNFPGANTWDARFFVLYRSPGTVKQPVGLSTNVVNAFEPNDSRLANWVGTYVQDSATSFYYPYKYKDYLDGDAVTEYLMVFRLAEQYLIRAEARAEQNANLSEAAADLNTIRARAGLTPISDSIASSQSALLEAILHERQVEFFTEWGHRWFDLIRTGNINSVMGSPGNICQAKGGNWSSNDTLAPLPLSETQVNPNLKQNPGYQ